MGLFKRGESGTGSPSDDVTAKFFQLVMDNHEGRLTPRRDPARFYTDTLCSGKWRVGFADLSPSQQQQLVDIGAVVLPPGKELSADFGHRELKKDGL